MRPNQRVCLSKIALRNVADTQQPWVASYREGKIEVEYVGAVFILVYL